MTPRPLLFREDVREDIREDVRNKIHRGVNAWAAAVKVTQDPCGRQRRARHRVDQPLTW